MNNKTQQHKHTVTNDMRDKLLLLKLNQSLQAFERWEYFNNMKCTQGDFYTLKWFKRFCERLEEFFYCRTEESITGKQLSCCKDSHVICTYYESGFYCSPRVKTMLSAFTRFSKTSKDFPNLSHEIETSITDFSSYYDTMGTCEGYTDHISETFCPKSYESEDLPF